MPYMDGMGTVYKLKNTLMTNVGQPFRILPLTGALSEG